MDKNPGDPFMVIFYDKDKPDNFFRNGKIIESFLL